MYCTQDGDLLAEKRSEELIRRLADEVTSTKQCFNFKTLAAS